MSNRQPEANNINNLHSKKRIDEFTIDLVPLKQLFSSGRNLGNRQEYRAGFAL